MGNSWQIMRIKGIGIFVHWTFLILIAWLIGVQIMRGETFSLALQGVAFVLALFACVLLHELGHALTAKKYNINTRDITLLPIGGVARLERMPEEPWHEFVIAIAGPAVNAGIAVVLLLLDATLMGLKGVSELSLVGGDILAKLLYINIALAVFNLLPAFPMDGGRILRAGLAARMDYLRATQYAASVGQMMAIAFAVFGLFYNWFLLFIALFVYLGAQQEAHSVQVRTVLRGVPVYEAMITDFKTLSKTARLSEAAEALLSGDQRDFPVMESGNVVGILGKDNLMGGLAKQDFNAPVSELMDEVNLTLTDNSSLETAFQEMQKTGLSTLPVMRNGKLVGCLNMENIGEWMMIQNYQRQARSRSDFGKPLKGSFTRPS